MANLEYKSLLRETRVLLSKLLKENAFYPSAIELDCYVKEEPKTGEEWEECLNHHLQKINAILVYRCGNCGIPATKGHICSRCHEEA